MRKTFAQFDDVLIERLFQPISDLATHRLGVSRRWAASFCVDIASFSWIVSRAQSLSDAVVAWEASAAFLDVLLLLLGLIALSSLRTLFRRLGGKEGNPLRPAMQPHRAIVLLMLVAQLLQLRAPGLPEIANLAMLTFAAAGLYLGACAERPPVRRASGNLVPAN